MYGAILGDIIGSRFEFDNIKSKNFNLLTEKNRYTDDSVLSLAIADYFLKYGSLIDQDKLANILKNFAKAHYFAGYGRSFLNWINSSNNFPYNSFGNGAAMRISPVAYVSNSLEECIRLSDFVTSITHNHSEGIKGARAISTSIYMLLNGTDKSTIKDYISKNYYDLNFDYDDLVQNYKFEISCQKSVPQAIYCFLISNDFIDAIKTAISIGGDSDTIADMTGALSEAYYLNNKTPINSDLNIEEIKNLVKKSVSLLDENMRNTLKQFELKYNNHLLDAIKNVL